MTDNDTEPKAPSAGTAAFRSRGKYPYSRFLTILFLVVLFSGLMALLDLPSVYFVAVLVVAMPPLLFFSISPLLTGHTVAPDGIRLRQGWYFSAFIPASNVKEVGLSEEDTPPRSLSYSPRRRRLFVTLSSTPLAYIELAHPAPMPFSSGRPVQTVVLSLDDPEGFVRHAGKALGAPVVLDRRCPECRRPVAAAEEARPGGGPSVPRPGGIEHLFLIHQDGRLIFQYAGGRLQPISSTSVSGMLVVIQDFIRDAFKTEGGALRKLEQGDLTVVIEPGGSVYLAAVLSGPEVPAGLQDSMRAVLKDIEREFGEKLRQWDGVPPEGIGKAVSQVLWA